MALTLLLMATTMSVALLTWSRRLWLPVGGGQPWWRATVLTRAEDLRVGASALALMAMLSALGALAAADAWYDRVGALVPVHAVVVAHRPDSTLLALRPTLTRGPRTVRLGSQVVRAATGSVVRLYASPEAVVADDEPSAWNVWSGSSVLLLAVSTGATFASLRPGARWRLVTYW
jgi:hypothetical protein